MGIMQYIELLVALFLAYAAEGEHGKRKSRREREQRLREDTERIARMM